MAAVLAADAMAHAVLAHIRMWGGEWEAAIAEARTALVLNPNSAFVISMLGCVLGFGGYREEALARLQQAMRASPHDPLTWLWTLWTAVMQFYSRQFDAARQKSLIACAPGSCRARSVWPRLSPTWDGSTKLARFSSALMRKVARTLVFRGHPGSGQRITRFAWKASVSRQQSNDLPRRLAAIMAVDFAAATNPGLDDHHCFAAHSSACGRRHP
ncbi:MAG TPA: hypothetical protein VFQ87_01535 [Bradyrhizobium sp.]|nr:hypothetical protein [Bradyrhizobium sp.]